jgi:chorismate mutase
LDVQFATEVASPEHVELALKNDIKLVWIGARTTVNPFNVQEIAESLRGVNIPVLVKNPVNPDLSLWIGALERLNKVGISELGAIHRGFSTHQNSKYRNIPLWQIPIELKTQFPDLPLICDPSHIAGSTDLVQEIAQKALDLNYDGLMIETHIDPKNALSDAKQQLTPAALKHSLDTLNIRKPLEQDPNYQLIIEEIRDQIDEADREIIDALARRFSLVERIGHYKKENNVAIFQISRWKEVFKTRADWGKAMQMNEDFIKEIYRLIHQESIKTQTKIFDEHVKKHTP